MKYQIFLPLSLALLAPILNSQTSDSQISRPRHSVAAARCQYTPSDQLCPPGDVTDPSLAQARGRIGPMPPRRPIVYSSRGYMPRGNAKHALIGGLIGFGIGAALGLKANKDHHPGAAGAAVVLIGGTGGLIGAAVGAGIPSYQSRMRYRRGPWPDEGDERASNRSRHADHSPPDAPAVEAKGGERSGSR
jgi:hypothetical protein